MVPQARILSIEDEPGMSSLLQLIFERQGHRVISVKSGEFGLEMLKSLRPDVLLLDLMLPDIDGWDIYQQMKEDEELADLPVVISHASGDEGYDYEQRLKDYSRLMGVNTLFVSDIINEHRGQTADGRKIYTLQDIYPYADLVTYPSTFEGFGNAFLEAIYFRKSIVVNAYSIYTKDIKPKGFSVIEIDGFVTPDAVEKTKLVLDNPQLRREMVEHNYELGLKYFSYSVLHRGLRGFLISKGLLASKS